ncbi:MAG: alpha/beta hydrolase [Pseudomonadota bacterium]
MPLDPIVKGLLDQMAAQDAPPMWELDPATARAGMAALADLQGAPESVANVENQAIPGPAGEIPVRIYTPEGTGPFPLLVYYHGGGWVIMDLDSHDGICRALCNAANCVVMSVDYRLAPEAKYPAAVDDCYAALEWAAANAGSLSAKADCIAVAGDSAGGNLSAIISQLARDRNGPKLVYQVLHCPVTNYGYDFPSYEENAEGYMLTIHSMKWFWGHYLNNDSDGESTMASPLRADNLSGLPPALVQTAEFDPLRDEGIEYAKKLEAAGVSTKLNNYAGMVHDPFLMFGVIPQGRAMIDEAAACLREAFGKA